MCALDMHYYYKGTYLLKSLNSHSLHLSIIPIRCLYSMCSIFCVRCLHLFV